MRSTLATIERMIAIPRVTISAFLASLPPSLQLPVEPNSVEKDLGPASRAACSVGNPLSTQAKRSIRFNRKLVVTRDQDCFLHSGRAAESDLSNQGHSN